MSRIEKLTAIARRYAVADVYAFGSRSENLVLWLADKLPALSDIASDIDIAVMPTHKESWGPKKRVEMAIELEDLTGASRVDLVLLPEADPFLALDIIRGELLYTDDPDRQARYELFVLRRAGDLLPLKKERMRLILEGGAR